MGENNGGAGMKKADLLILKVDRLAKQTATVDAKLTAVVNSRGGTSVDAITRLTEENQALKQELRYLAAQTESVYSNLAGLINKLNSEIEDLKSGSVTVGTSTIANLDMDELSSKVAEKIIIPRSQGDIDYNLLATRVAERVASRDMNVEVDSEQVAQKVVEKLSGTGAETLAQASDGSIDVNELGTKIVSNMYIPKAIVEDIDYDALSEKLAAKLNLGERVVTSDGTAIVSPAIDYDELGTKIVSNLYIPKAIVEDIDYDTLSEKLAEKVSLSDKINVVAPASEEVAATSTNIDYDELGSKIVNSMYIPKAVVEEIDYDSLAGKIDYDQLGTKIAEKISISDRINVAEVNDTPANVTVDYDELSKKVAENLAGSIVLPESAPVDIDYDVLAEKLASALPAQEVISTDDIASKVAEQIVIPAVEPQEAQSPEIDIETLSRKIADKIAIPAVDVPEVVVDEDKIAYAVAEKVIAAREEEEKTASSNIDEQALASALAEKLNISLSDEIIADAVVKNLANAIDSEEIADCVAKKVGSISPEQFDIMVDDDGCESLAKSIVEKLDCASIASSVSEKLTPIIMSNNVDIDTEELAKTLSEKISVSATVNEDVIADKAAAVLSNYLPDFDTDEIADKVVAGIIPSIPAAPVIDYDTITNSVSDSVAERIIENQEDKDFDIVIDDEGLSHITENISTELKQEYSQRLDSVDGDVENIKTEIENIKSLIEARSDETREQNSGRLDTVDADIDNIQAQLEELKNLIESKYSQLETKSEETDEESSKEIEAVNADFGNIQSEIDEIKNLIESKNTESREENSNRLDSVDGEIENIKSELAEIKALLENANATPAENEDSENAEETANNEANTARFDSVDSEIENIKAELAEIKSLIENTTAVADTEGNVVNVVHTEDNSGRFDSLENEISDVKQYVTSGEITKNIEERIDELKKLVLSGVVISSATNEIAPAAAEVKEEPDEENEELVTVSDIVTDEPEENEGENDEVIGEIIDDIDEAPADGEIMPDGIYGISNSGVDFASMMKYNRSFIARIIQGSDEVKQYYGEVKSTLLSYKKVNSNIAWGAERFNKGRETIAKFKIRGKTLCLYLALDPNDYKTSVYHHTDVSDNKSMRGTPMMVKIKSPLGVKKAVRLIDDMLAKRDGVKQPIKRRDYAAMYPFESIEELIEDGLVKDVSKK